MIVPTVLFVPGPWSGAAVVPVTPPPPAADFWAALLAWFKADPDLPGWFPGGLTQGPSAVSRAYPYLSVVEAEPQEALSAEDWQMEARFGSVAAGPTASSDCRRLADAFLAKLDAGAARPPLTFGNWREAGHRTSRTAVSYKVGYGQDGVDVWRYDFQVVFNVLLTVPGSEARP